MLKKEMRNLTEASLPLLTVLLVFAIFLCPPEGSSSTTIYVHPSQSTTSVGKTFVIDIKISDVTDLYGWEFKLRWNANILDAVEITEGPFLKQGGSTFFHLEINNTQGYLHAKCTLLGEVSGVNGSGTLASVQFYAEKEGSSILDLDETKLSNSFEQPISHIANDGTVTVSKPVGGVIIPPSRLELLAPWLTLTSIIVISITVLAVFVKRRAKRNEA